MRLGPIGILRTRITRAAHLTRPFTTTMEPSVQSPLFTREVVQAMRCMYPEELADRAWDNVGLLQENINPTSGTVPRRVLLTNDLTLHVAEEAITKQASVIVSYRKKNSMPPVCHTPLTTPTQTPSSSAASSPSPSRTRTSASSCAWPSTTSPCTARTRPSTPSSAASTTGSPAS